MDVMQSDSTTGNQQIEVRPWGTFQVILETHSFKLKCITVFVNSQISYQSHAKREEHWTIISGEGEVVLNDRIIKVQPSTHVHIPLGAKHRIRNTGTSNIELIEVQLGSYFGEDDIVRYSDDYGR